MFEQKNGHNFFNFILLSAIFSLTTLFVCGQTPTAPQNLSLNKSIERQIKGGETHIFQFDLKAGFYARAEVEQKNIDVVVSLFDADGKLVVEMDGKNGYLWRESVSAMAENAETKFQIKIRAYGTAENVGNYTIKLAESRSIETKDRQRLEAEQHFYKGRKFYLQDTPNLNEAIKEYEFAQKNWQDSGEKYWEGVTLWNLAYVYRDLSKNEIALATMEKASTLFQEINDRIGQGKAFNGLGVIYSDLRQLDKSAQFYEKALPIRRELKDKRGEGNTLYNLGNVYYHLSQYEKAKDYFEQSLVIKREIKDRRGEGSVLNNLGDVYESLSQYEKAKDYYEQSLVIRREIKDRSGEGVTLSNLGIVYESLSQYEKAKDYYEQSLVIRREIKDRSGEGQTLGNLGNVYNNLAQYEKAKDYYEQSLVISREIKDRSGEGVTLSNLGIVYESLSQYEKAKDYYEQSLVIFREIKDRSGEGKTLGNLGSVYERLSQYEKAKDYYEQSLVIRREIKDRRGECKTLGNLGSVYNNLAQYEKAKDYYEQSLVIRREIKDRSGEGKTLGNLGIVYESLSQYEKAKDYYEQSLVIRREIKDRSGEGQTLGNLGNVYNNLAQYEKAKDYYEQSLVIFREIKDRRGEGKTLGNLGSVYNNLAQYEKAKDYFEQSLVIYREVKDRSGEGHTLNNLGNVYYHLSQYEKAKDYYEQSLIIYREVKDRSGEGKTLGNLGSVYNNLAQYEKAKDYYEQSLVIRREIKDRSGEGSVLNNLGSVYDNLAQYEKAKDYYEQSLVIFREIKDRSGEGSSYRNLLLLSERLKNPKLAILYGKQAVNVYQEIRGNIKGLDKELQQSFLADKIPVYRRLSDILISEGRFAEAQAVLDLIKEQEYKDLTRSGEIADTVPYSKSEAEVVAKIDNLAAFGREQTELRKLQKESGDKFPADKLKRLEQLNIDIKLANVAFENALSALAKADVSVEARTLEIKGEKNLQSALLNLGKELNTGTVALYTVIGTAEETDANGKPRKDQTRSKFGWVILVTAKDRKAYPIDVTNLEKNVFEFRAALSSDRYDPQPLAEKIYTAIFRQTSAKQKTTLEADLQAYLGASKDKTLMWSLDGVLRYIPMAALHDGKQYLVENYRNTVFTKESLLWLMAQPQANPQTLGLGVSAGNKELKMSELPGVERELADIIKQTNEKTGILNGIRKINAQFKSREILDLKDEDNTFRTVHIASHYSFNLTDQNLSYLLVGDGKLTFGEMKTENNLFGTVDLLTLSACDTGVSGNGKEAEGFAYLAQSLGAKSVIASLWKVSDMGTPELMIRFYKLRAENPAMSKGEAFRQAQISLLGATGKDNNSSTKRAEIVDEKRQKIELPLFVKDAKHPFAHPHYWSSFVLIGNWR